MVLSQRLFLTFSGVEVRIDGVFVVSRHRDAVAVAARESERDSRRSAQDLWSRPRSAATARSKGISGT